VNASGSFADWIVAISTVIALFFAAFQLRANARSAGQTHAREAWLMYLELGLQNPDLGSDQLAIKQFEFANASELIAGEKLDSERYLWFQSVMLEACESLLEYFPQETWTSTIKFNLSLHKEVLRLMWPF
jgi:hypothetical protein